MFVPSGCLTAMVTPFNQDGSIDWEGMKKNIEFQISQGVKGVVPVGTTGESPTLTPEEHSLVFARTVDFVKKRVFVLAGSGSNSTKEALHYTEVAAKVGCDGALLVDCYYNGPSSLELMEEYYSPIAEKFPELAIVPYIIPGRTGCALSAEDLALLAWKYRNLSAVKEATGDLERMRKTRRLVPDDFKIFSGDDDITYTIMTDSEIRASGVISVISNIAPAFVQEMCARILSGYIKEAEEFKKALAPLFKVVTVKKERIEEIPNKGRFSTEDKFRNPLPIKTMMQGLGMPAGPCRQPLGKMTFQAVKEVREALKVVWEKNPEVLKPIEEFYKVSVSDRLADDEIWKELTFTY